MKKKLFLKVSVLSLLIMLICSTLCLGLLDASAAIPLSANLNNYRSGGGWYRVASIPCSTDFSAGFSGSFTVTSTAGFFFPQGSYSGCTRISNTQISISGNASYYFDNDSGSYTFSLVYGSGKISVYCFQEDYQSDSGTEDNGNLYLVPTLLDTYKVTFDLDGGTRSSGGETVQYIIYGNAAIAPNVYRTGYEFLGWDKSFNNVTSQMTVTAQWRVLTYTITFNLAGGNRIGGGATTQQISYGGSATAPMVEREGYEFDGWDKSFSYVTSSYTVTAKWKTKSFLVTFNLAGGNLEAGGGPLSQMIELGQAATAPLTSRTGYDFDGWDKAFDYITDTTTVTAQWSPSKYTISYNLHGGALPDGYPEKHTYATATLLPTPTKSGYRFDGWFLASDFSGSSTSTLGAYAYTSEIKVYAKWTDAIAPEITFFDTTSQEINAAATNQSFYVAMTDAGSGIKLQQYRIKGDTAWTTYTTGQWLFENFTTYEFLATDNDNNTASATMYLCKVENFGNFQSLQLQYSVTTWHLVNLPGRVFTTSNIDIAGKYTFVSYSDALSWAMEKEYEFRVIDVESGYIYVTTTNENVSKLYSTKEEVLAAVKFYAEKYISQATFSRSGNSYYNAMSSDGQADDLALVDMDIVLPSFLAQYDQLQLILASYKTALSKFAYASSMITSTVTLTYLASDICQAVGSSITIPYGQTIQQALTQAGAFMQGYYLYEETDSIGNSESFLVYIDCAAPSIEAKYTLGTASHTVSIDASYYALYGTTFYFLSFEITDIFDIDTLSMVEIIGGKVNAAFTNIEDIPVLSQETTGGGFFTIHVFDRSFNVFTIEVYISSSTPSLSYGSLNNAVRLNLSVNINDKYNTFLSIQLFKVLNDGSYVELTHDSNGTLVEPATTSYVLTEGGKYVVKVTDIYGRTAEFEPFFYTKDLPTASLAGVTSGGVTKDSVTVTFARTNSYVVYYIDDTNQRHVLDSANYNTATNATNYVLTFPNTIQNNQSFVIYMWATSNDTLFNEYMFTIDTIVAEYAITEAQDGRLLSENSTVNSGFIISSNEVIYVRYSAFGSTITKTYSVGTVFNLKGIYSFTVTDSIGNSSQFTMTIDNSIDFSITGKHTLYANMAVSAYNDIGVTITEQFSLMSAKYNGESFTFSNGMTLSDDGNYEIELSDAFGNTGVLKITLSTAPPSFTLVNVIEDGSTNDYVSISFDETVTCRVNGSLTASGTAFTAEGKYRAVLTALNGKTAEVNWTIDKSIAFTVTGAHKMNGAMSIGAYDSITLTISEVHTLLSATLNGSAYEFVSGTALTSDGDYSITIQDAAGNIGEFIVVIDSAEPAFALQNVVANGITSREVTLTFDDRTTCVVNNQIIASGATFADEGAYEAVLTASNGKTVKVAWTIDKSIDFAVTGKHNLDGATSVIAYNSIILAITEEHTVKSAMFNQGTFVFESGDSLSQDGEYLIVVEDLLGNIAEIRVLIDTAYPVYALTNVQPNGVTNKEVTLNFDDRHTCKINNQTVVSGAIISAEGRYTAVITATNGKMVTLHWTIDKQVSYTLSIENGQITNSGVTLILNETMQSAEYYLNGNTLKSANSFTAGGNYEVIMTDLAGNTETLNWIILPKRSTDLVLEVPKEWEIVGVTLNGAEVALGSKKEIEFFIPGNYEVALQSLSGIVSVFYIEIDNIPPTANVYASLGKLIIDDISKDDVTIQLLLDGEDLGYRSSVSYTERGLYTIILTDSLGNTTTYKYEMPFTFNEWSIVLFVLSALAVVAIVFIFFRAKKVKA